MKKLAFVIAAAATLWTAPSFAQGFGVDIGPRGVRVGERGYDRGYDRGYHRGWARERYGYRRWDRPAYRMGRERVIIRRHDRY